MSSQECDITKVCKSCEKSHSLNSLAGCVSAVDVLIPLPTGKTGHLTHVRVLSAEVGGSQCMSSRWAEASLARGEHRPASFLSFVRMLMVRLGVIQNQIKWD